MVMEASSMADQLLFDSQIHSTRPLSSSSLPQQVSDKGGGAGVLPSLLAGLNRRLKEKWDSYNRPKSFKRPLSLFVSPRADFAAVAVGNEITVLRKDDNFVNPCGFFTSDNNFATFVDGVWLEERGVLGILDSLGSIYLLGTDGRKIMRVTLKQLKIFSPTIGLIASKDSSFFHVLSGDGILYRVMIDQDPCASAHPEPALGDHAMENKQFLQNALCLNFHPDLSLLVVVGGCEGSFCLSLWHVTAEYGLQFLSLSPRFQGIFHPTTDYLPLTSSPKVVISPQGVYIAVLDMAGSVYLFNRKSDLKSLIVDASNKLLLHRDGNLRSDNESCLADVVDFTWWCDRRIIFSKRDGSLSILDIETGSIILMQTKRCMFLLERVLQCPGYVFALDCPASSDQRSMTSESMTTMVKNQGTLGDLSSLQWCLTSFLEKSVPEMYAIFISRQQFVDALSFARRHGLNTDEIFKSQWLLSDVSVGAIESYLSNIEDQDFVLTECVKKVGYTEDAMRSLITLGLSITDRYKHSVLNEGSSGELCEVLKARLQLLQCRDRLETFIGINMGRFSVLEYTKFRVLPLNDAAIVLAEGGKIGALNLLFKRHPCSLSPFILQILSSIPETISVQSYSQLLPGKFPPSTFTLREPDWIESGNLFPVFDGILEKESKIDIKTEIILKLSVGYVWPSISELCIWYKNRVRDIDVMSGQLDNCLSLVELAYHKGILELQYFGDDLKFFSQFVYSDVCSDDGGFTMSYVTWEKLSQYEKFKLILKGVKRDTVVARLKENAVPFMRKQFSSENMELSESFLVQWLKEIALGNNLEICLLVIEEGFKDMRVNGFFNDEVEAAEVALHCIYSCTLTDQWKMMEAILSLLTRQEVLSFSNASFSPRHRTRAFRSFGYVEENDKTVNLNMSQDLKGCNKATSFQEYSTGLRGLSRADKCGESLKRRVQLAEAHVEAGRLLSLYQVPKPVSFFLKAHMDEKAVKQLLRLILSKFGRRQPGRSDNDWVNMWKDMQILRESAFPFLDLEYMLTEFCRGLLKAGKFALARNYLKGTGSISLAPEKAENLVIQASREYFFSASSLSCTDIWKAKECLSLMPNSRHVKAEADIIDALTIKLPNLGVTVLPVQFRQIKDPMEIIHMVIKNQSGGYFDVDELIEIAKLLGLGSQDNIALIHEAVAREAAVAGDLHLAFDTCLELVKKDHGPIWDLCAAIARGPLDNVDVCSRKKLLGFALSHCDEESVADLLHAWKDFDIQVQCEKLTEIYGTNPQTNQYELGKGDTSQEYQLQNILKLLSSVARDPFIIETIGDSSLQDNCKFLNFAVQELPWLIQLSNNDDSYSRTHGGAKYNLQSLTSRTRTLGCIITWLSVNSLAPNDDLIASLANSFMSHPFSEEGDILGCSVLLNLYDAIHGVAVVEKELASRNQYQEICSIMDIGMKYGSLNNSGLDCCTPGERRNLLLEKFQAKPMSMNKGEMEKVNEVQSTFWREWKDKLEGQKQLANQARSLEKLMPGVDSARFLSRDSNYIKNNIFMFIDSAKVEKKPVLKEALALAIMYDMDRCEVLLRCVASILVSEQWTSEDIYVEVSPFKAELLDCSERVISMVSLSIYPEIDGHNKMRLACIYSLLSECFIWMEQRGLSAIPISHDLPSHTLEMSQFCKLLEHECRRLSFVEVLNFKNIAGLSNLNFVYFNQEVCDNISASTIEALAEMAETLLGIYDKSAVNGLVTRQHIYRHHVQNLLKSLESGKNHSCKTAEEFLDFLHDVKRIYDCCKMFVQFLSAQDVLDAVDRYSKLSFYPIVVLSHDSSLLEPFTLLLDFLLQLTEDVKVILSYKMTEMTTDFDLDSFSKCLVLLNKLLKDSMISVHEGCLTISDFMVRCFMKPGISNVVSNFSQSMLLSGCEFKAVAAVYAGTSSERTECLQDLQDLYVGLMDLLVLGRVDGISKEKNLSNLLYSLNKLDGDLEILDIVRQAVWKKLFIFSNNMQLERQIRVYSLQLLQLICGKKAMITVDESFNVLPWEGWNGCFSSDTGNLNEDRGQQPEVSCRLTSTLVALKSTQLVAATSSLEVTPDDLMNIDTAFSCFLRLSSFATCNQDFDILVSVLEEWEGLFVGTEEEKKIVKADEENWGNDDWGDGWESFTEQGENQEQTYHPLHACWAEIFKRLLNSSQFSVVMKTIDKRLTKCKGILLTEDEAQSLYNLMVEIDCFAALKIMLLLPYKTIWLECLNAVEAHLNSSSNSNAAMVDIELLVLILSSKTLSLLCVNSSYTSTFSYVCHILGFLSRSVQECQSSVEQQNGDKSRTVNEKTSLLFSKIVFPCFVSELVLSSQFLLAGFIISKVVRVLPPVSIINTAHASIKKYLEGEVTCPQRSNGDNPAFMDACGPLANTVFALKDRVVDLLREALSTLSEI